MFRSLGFCQLATDRLQPSERAFLVLAHQPRIAGDVGRHYRRQPPLDALSPGVHADDATPICSFYLVRDRCRRGEPHLRPILCTVIVAHDFDRFCFEPIHTDEGKRSKHKFASARYPALTSEIGE